MIEAKRCSWNLDGEKEHLRMDDLLACVTVEDEAGFAVEEMFEA